MNKYSIDGNEIVNNIKQVLRSAAATLVMLFSAIAISHAVNGYSSGKWIEEAREAEDIYQQQRRVRGVVADKEGEALPGATVVVDGTTRGVITDIDGAYSIDVNPSDKLVFSFVGMENQTIEVGTSTTINVTMQDKIDELEEVTIVAFGKQKKESVISSISTVNTADLKIPSSNLSTAFAGKIAGMISYQTSGEPGQDDANYFVRGITTFGTGKVDPLILIDNMEVNSSDLNRLNPDDIQSFSVLKDATATALYGARGANGVILITTKEGKEGKVRVSLRVENSFSQPTTEIEMADPITYMRMSNEASQSRGSLNPLVYSNEKIDNTIKNTNPYVYPAVDWRSLTIKDYTMNQRFNLNISGGGNISRYYIAGSFTQDNGILKVDKRNNFNNNINLKKYSIRSNININLTKTTEAVVRVHGAFDDYIGPISGGSTVYSQNLKVSPVRFPAYYEPDETYALSQHILFGNAGEGGEYLNPYAEMIKGYKETRNTVMMAQGELKQDLSMITPGLAARILANATSYSYFDLQRSYNPYYYNIASYDRATNKYSLVELNPLSGTEYLGYSEGGKSVSRQFYSEMSLSYDRIFDRHGVSGMLIFLTREELTGNAGNLSNSLPHRNLGLSGRFTYNYDSRYFSEFNFGYNGSEKFDKNHRWGFFPSLGLGWIISNENFWGGDILDNISLLKLRGTYGLVGNDAIGAERFFYLSRVNIGGGEGYSLGYDFSGKSRTGVSISHYSNPAIGWEVSSKANLAMELGLFKDKFNIIAEVFKERRTNILQTRADIPTTMGLWSTPQANIGEASGRGFELELDYKQSFSNDFWVTARGNFTYARSLFEKYEEPDYWFAPWKSRVGQPISQLWGYVAERLFIDDADVLNSPIQDFGEYGPGDIKYKDINNDGVINTLDQVPIGFPTTPEINYGFGASIGYKNFDFSFFFHGSARSSFWIDSGAMSPFVRSGRNETGLAKFIADDYWSYSTQNPLAEWPRLSLYKINNNNERSTWFMRDGSYLRLKNVEIGYSLPNNLVNKIKLETCRIYLNGSNLFLLSKFDIWDIELGGNGLNYPLQRVANLGINISF
jgi:TonB-linked SusC/RagA family outer membrane protein